MFARYTVDPYLWSYVPIFPIRSSDADDLAIDLAIDSRTPETVVPLGISMITMRLIGRRA
jgi:hypothetical protein